MIKNRVSGFVVLVCSVCVFASACYAQKPDAQTFQNPIVLAQKGFAAADPSVVFHDGFYYWARSYGARGIGISKARRLQDIGIVPAKIVFVPPAPVKELWAPELLLIRQHWYLYYAASEGARENLRMYVAYADSSDPQGGWTFHGKLATPDDHWAIDGTVLQKQDGALYFIWSGWESEFNDHNANLYIAAMRDPLTLIGPRVRISSPTYGWERSPLRGVSMGVNEGPETIEHNGTISLVYSAAGSWSGQYKLGLLINVDGNVMNPDAWHKRPTPLFQSNPAGHAFGVGHLSLTQSPDGREDWFVYHGMNNPKAGWKGRSLRAQPFTWNVDDTPDLGVADADGASRREPSGTPRE